MNHETDVILCVDINNSQTNDYFAFLEKLLNEIKPRLKNIPIVCWSNRAWTVPKEEISKKLIKDVYPVIEKEPHCMISCIEKIVEDNKIDTFELIITTDGNILKKNVDIFRDKLKQSCFYTKIVNIRACFICYITEIRTELCHAFEELPLTIAIEGQIASVKKNLDIYADDRFRNFKMEDVTSLLKDLAVTLVIARQTIRTKDVIRKMLHKLEKKYTKCLLKQESPKLRAPNAKKDPAEYIHGLIKKRNIEELREYYNSLLREQNNYFNYKKLRKLYSILDQFRVECFDLMLYFPNAMEIQQVREKQNIINEEEEANRIHEDKNLEDLCSIKDMDPNLPVIHVTEDAYSMYTVDGAYIDCNKISECPLFIFETTNAIRLNEIITCYSKAKELQDLDSSLSIENMYGVMLYNFTESSDLDLYEDKESELYRKKSKLDDDIVDKISAFTSRYIYSEKANRGLWAIAFLYSLYNTNKIQNNEFMKKCVRYTIIRISLMFKCNLAVSRSAFPRANVVIHDALLCAVHIASSEPEAENSFFRKLGDTSPVFIQMMKKIFNQEIPGQEKVNDWLAAKYLLDHSKASKNHRTVESIIKTKVQDWINTEKGPLLIEGKTNDKDYNDALKGYTIEALYKMVSQLKENRIKVPKDFDFSSTGIDIPADIAETKQISQCKIDYHKHVWICKTTCRPTFFCNKTNYPWKQCIPIEFRAPHLSFFNIFCRYCRQHKKYPTVKDMLNYLVELYPKNIYYRNTPEILSEIVEKFTALELDVEIFIQRYVSSASEERRIELELTCECSAHRIHLSFKMISIYVLICAILLYMFLLEINYSDIPIQPCIWINKK